MPSNTKFGNHLQGHLRPHEAPGTTCCQSPCNLLKVLSSEAPCKSRVDDMGKLADMQQHVHFWKVREEVQLLISKMLSQIQMDLAECKAVPCESCSFFWRESQESLKLFHHLLHGHIDFQKGSDLGMDRLQGSCGPPRVQAKAPPGLQSVLLDLSIWEPAFFAGIMSVFSFHDTFQ